MFFVRLFVYVIVYVFLPHTEHPYIHYSWLLMGVMVVIS